MHGQMDTSGDRLESLNLPQKLLGLFTAPRATFLALSRSITPTDLAVPLVILLALSIGTQVAVRPLMLAVREQIILQREDIPDERKDAALERVRSFTKSPWSPLWSAVTLAVWYAILAGVILFFGSFILGGEVPPAILHSGGYMAALVVVLYAGLVGVVEWAVKLPLILHLDTLNIRTGMGLFLPRSLDGTLTQRFLAGLDFFAMWKIYLASIGIALLYQVPEKQARTLLFSAWVVVMFLLAWVALGGRAVPS